MTNKAEYSDDVDNGDACTWATAAAEAALSCVTSDVTATTTTTASVDDEETDRSHHHLQPNDVADCTNDNLQTISGTASEDRSADAAGIFRLLKHLYLYDIQSAAEKKQTT